MSFIEIGILKFEFRELKKYEIVNLNIELFLKTNK